MNIIIWKLLLLKSKRSYWQSMPIDVKGMSSLRVYCSTLMHITIGEHPAISMTGKSGKSLHCHRMRWNWILLIQPPRASGWEGDRRSIKVALYDLVKVGSIFHNAPKLKEAIEEFKWISSRRIHILWFLLYTKS